MTTYRRRNEIVKPSTAFRRLLVIQKDEALNTKICLDLFGRFNFLPTILGRRIVLGSVGGVIVIAVVTAIATTATKLALIIRFSTPLFLLIHGLAKDLSERRGHGQDRMLSDSICCDPLKRRYFSLSLDCVSRLQDQPK